MLALEISKGDRQPDAVAGVIGLDANRRLRDLCRRARESRLCCAQPRTPVAVDEIAVVTALTGRGVEDPVTAHRRARLALSAGIAADRLPRARRAAAVSVTGED